MAADVTELKFDAKEMILGVKAAKVAFSGLDRVLSSIARTMEEAFSVKGYNDIKIL